MKNPVIDSHRYIQPIFVKSTKAMEERQPCQQMVLGQLDIIGKNEPQPKSHNSHKN